MGPATIPAAAALVTMNPALADRQTNPQRHHQRPLLTGLDAPVDYVLNSIRHRAQRQAHYLELARNAAAASQPQIEAFSRVVQSQLNIAPYPEQVAGALAIIDSNLVEMATGEGKTLTLAMAAACLSKPHLPIHIVTANDYLAARDADEFTAVFKSLNLSCAAVTSALTAKDRRKAYQADVVYTTAKELLADFLRDQIRSGQPASGGGNRIHPQVDTLRVLRGVHHVLVDEADHLLIDEAQTPLVISQEVDSDSRLITLYRDVFRHIDTLQEQSDYEVNEQQQAINLKPAALTKMSTLLDSDKPFFKNPNWLYTLIKRALAVQHFLIRDQHYLIRENKIVLIDQATGRVMANRTFGQGRHTLVEIKEGLPLTPQQQTIGSMGFQRFFRGVPFLAGVSGTLWENRRELWQLYQRSVIRIPTHKPLARVLMPSQVHESAAEKWQAIAALTQTYILQGGAVLIGTASVTDSELCANALRQAGLAHQLLNASLDEEEANIVAGAGISGQVTVATNMAGRGTDIRIDHQVIQAGGLLVIAAQWAQTARLDRQLFGRCARQGDPGQALIIADLQDSLFSRYLSRAEVAAVNFWHRQFGLTPRVTSLLLWRIRFTVNRAQRKQRLAVFEQDQWLSKHFFSHD